MHFGIFQYLHVGLFNTLGYIDMSRRKLEKFAQIKDSDKVLDRSFFYDELGGRTENTWTTFFGNSNPITLELGCGYGEYTIGLAQQFPGRNFIGIDVKGDRLWTGMTRAEELNLSNVAFIRSEVSRIPTLFHFQQIAELWIPFPDPQPKKQHLKLTHPRYIEMYKLVLQENGLIHLKTDDEELFNFTKEMVAAHGFFSTQIDDIYPLNTSFPALNIQTKFEKKWLAEGKTIRYIQFNPSYRGV